MSISEKQKINLKSLSTDLESLSKSHKLDIIVHEKERIKAKIDSGVSAKAVCGVLLRHGIKTTPGTLRSWAGVASKK